MTLKGIRDYYLKQPALVAYMLQSTEYEVVPYLKWYWRTDDFSRVMHRRTLDLTRRARLLLMALRLGMALQIILAISIFLAAAIWPQRFSEGFAFGAAVLLSYPLVWAHLVVIPLLGAKWLVVKPKNKKAVEASEKIFAGHTGATVAITGSYGKTTMKELLATILSEGKKVAATPANKNVASSHARFARQLDGDEDILLLEYGEGAPGDVIRFARTTHPTHAVITGLAPAHLDKYKTLERAGEDIFSVAGFVPPGQVYVNAESPAAEPFIKKDFVSYSKAGLGGWKVGAVSVGFDGTRFTLKKGSTTLRLHSGLLGKHQIGPLSAAAVLALELGLTPAQVEAGVRKTASYEHRMQPYRLGGAWILDDTYNGNLEGIRAGTELLKDLEAKRKWYVTPGLVDQGKDTSRIHREAGRLIAAARPDIVVLMVNSVTADIRKGLEAAGYAGEIRLEEHPLEFYTNLEQFVTAGDVVLMQNDWTDNYA